MKYFVAPGEDRLLDAAARTYLRGDFVELSDGVTHYELSGPDVGETVVVTGGLTVPLSYWDAVASALHARGLRTLTYSAYGRGYSDRIDARYDERLFVRQLADLISALDLPPRYHLMGASMGALVAMSYLNQLGAPDAATLCIVGPAGLGRRPAAQRLLRTDVTGGLIARSLGRRIFDHHQSHNIRDPQRAADLSVIVDDAYRFQGSLFAFFDTLQHFDLFARDELYQRTSALPTPSLVIWGADDRVTPISGLDHVRRLLQPDTYRVIEHCGHMAPFERPTLVADTFTAFATAHEDR